MASSSMASDFLRSPSGVVGDLSGHVGIGPGRLGAGGLPGRIGHGLLPKSMNGEQRSRVARSADHRVKFETVEVNRAGESSVGCSPRDGTIERPIDFDGAGVPLKPRNPLATSLVGESH